MDHDKFVHAIVEAYEGWRHLTEATWSAASLALSDDLTFQSPFETFGKEQYLASLRTFGGLVESIDMKFRSKTVAGDEAVYVYDFVFGDAVQTFSVLTSEYLELKDGKIARIILAFNGDKFREYLGTIMSRQGP